MDPIVAAIIIAAIAAIPPTMAALATFKQSKINGARTEEIHVLVNGGVLALKAELAAAQERIQDLQRKLGRQDGIKAARGERRPAKQS